MEKSFFFNSSNGDRKYLAEDFAEYFSALLKNGVFLHETDALRVEEHSGRQIIIHPGKAFINGYAYKNTAVEYKTLDSAVINRIDRLALRLDMTERAISIVVKKGTPAASPVAEELIRDADLWELGLADVFVSAGAVNITDADIVDLREDGAFCGGVTMLVDRDQILGDITNTFVQFEQASTRANIENNDPTATIMGKIKKYFTDLRALAFKQNISANDIEAGAVTENKLATGSVSSTKIASSGLLINNIAGLGDALLALGADNRQQYINYTTLNQSISTSPTGNGASITLLSGKTPADILAVGFRLNIGGFPYFFQGFKNVYDFTNFNLIGYRHFYSGTTNTTHWAAGEFSIQNTGVGNEVAFYCRNLVIHKVSPESGALERPATCTIYYLQIFYK